VSRVWVAAILASALVTGCGASARQAASIAATSAAPRPPTSSPATTLPSATPQVSPDPVSTAATLSSRCVTGFVTVNPSTGRPVNFVPFTDLSALRPGPNVHGGYQVTFTDTSAIPAEVNEFSVAFYEGGADVGSVTAGPFSSPKFITQAQSLTWTATTDAMNVGTQGAVATDDTCAVVQWTAP
jgi:hypothetical protein